MAQSYFKKILSPIDFDENSLKALDAAADIARLADATILVLHIVSPIGLAATQNSVDAKVAEERRVGERLKAICEDRLKDVRYEISTRTGDAAIGIIRAEEELNADLVVIATHSSRKRPRRFPGSVAERVIRESVRPVLTVRPSPQGDPDAVGSHMTPGPLTASPAMTVAQVQQMMVANRFSSLPVVEDHRLVGMVTDRDIAASDAPTDCTIGLLITRDVVTVSSKTSIQEAARMLLECEVEGLPVVDGERLVGIITRSDVLQAFAGVETRPALRHVRPGPPVE